MVSAVVGESAIVIGFDMETDIGSWTSDDRGVKEGTPEILRVLAKHRIPATFLFAGRECAAAVRAPDGFLGIMRTSEV